ncbi:MAG: bifunctional hydroxymethylpyrimidine kinase/phosphomethylpyrimidine kinase [Euryarchaeota archaeon]|nr:bifunctional hydroxymethylpyrimidine kinase/phosphomethylpyrimidine kinase [Euryarchaeota archaeon]
MSRIVCLTVAGSDSGGGAGIQADLKTFAALGVHGVSAITSVTAQNTCGVDASHHLPLEVIEAQLKSLHSDFKISAAKTGMLATREIIRLVAENVGDYPLVVDPVMVATSGDALQQGGAADALKKHLLPVATLITPNIHEAQVLSGIRIDTLEDARRAAVELGKLVDAVVITGGHLQGVDILFHRGELTEIPGKLLPGTYHGSGCTFSAAAAAYMARGLSLEEAVREAKRYTFLSLSASHAPGRCARVPDHLFPLKREAERHRVLTALEDAVGELLRLPGFPELIPEVGVNLAHSIPLPASLEDVAGIRGRIVRAGDRAVAAGCVSFGASRHVGRVVLAASSREPRIRAAMNILYSPEVVGAAQRAGLKVGSFSREDEPRGTSTMEWGTLSAIDACGFVPDIIYDLGAHGKEPMVRLLGESPRDVLKKLGGILRELSL